MMEITVSELLGSLTRLLSAKLDTARIDIEILITHALDWSREKLYIHGDYVLSQEEQDLIAALVNRRLKGEPIAYITGVQEFWSLPFVVTSATLIPRPETEHLVEEALKKIPHDEEWMIADLGTGSGALALCLANERPNSRVVAVDKSEDALAVAKTNREKLAIGNVEFIHSNWFEHLTNKQFDVIVSNPPYVAENDPHLSQGDVAFEPKDALSSEEEGLKDIKIILSGAKDFLKSNGWIFIEHGFDQAESVQQLMQDLNYKSITSVKDLAGHERLTFAQK